MASDSTRLPTLNARAAAAAAGEKTYVEPGKRCVHGHESPRYTSNGVCVQCSTERRKEPERITREAAREAGLKKYYTGPCRRGHRAPRYVNSGECTECARGWQNGTIVKGEFTPGRPTGIPDARQEELAERITATLQDLDLIRPGQTYCAVELLAIISVKAFRDDNLALAATAAAQAAKYLRPQLASVRVDANVEAHVEIDHGVADIFARVVSAETEDKITEAILVNDDDAAE
jgi:hypothetical protein